MTTRRRTIEKRLFDAVMLVIAGSAGCWQATTTPRQEPDPDRSTTFAQPPDGESHESPPPPPPLQPWPPSGLTAQQHANAYCDAYKRASRVDGSKAKSIPGHDGPEDQGISETGAWNPARKTAECTIVRERIQGVVEVMHTPTCCPTGRGNQPCPSGGLVRTQGNKLLVERVELHPDGSVGTSSLAWHTFPLRAQPRHNCGRRPEGMQLAGELELDGGRACDDLHCIGSELAAMAELEAASVPAFDRLARELAAHGAPEELVRRARAAMRDEVRHARVMTELAIHYGQSPRVVEVPELPCRTLAAIARENAIEGCVREAYGALVATYQAQRAAPELRATFDSIAADERAHAALAEDVATWITSVLGAADRADVARARTEAQRELRADLAASSSCVALGIPGEQDTVALFDAYFA